MLLNEEIYNEKRELVNVMHCSEAYLLEMVYSATKKRVRMKVKEYYAEDYADFIFKFNREPEYTYIIKKVPYKFGFIDSYTIENNK